MNSYCKKCNKLIHKITKSRLCRSCAAKLGWQKKINRSLNYKHGFYSKYKKTYNYCIDCNKQLSNKRNIRCNSCENKRRFKKGIMNTKGMNNGQYIHGMKKRKYPKEFNKQLKYYILKRDSFTCQKCLIYPTNKLSVHHIDYNKFNNELFNLTTLCRNCNSAVNTNRDYWYAYFTYIKEKI